MIYEFAGNDFICAPSRTGIRRTENNATPNPGGHKKTSFKQSKASMANYITAVEFMAAVKIGRSKFDQLVLGNKIKTIKKKRKIYLPVSEIDRYFKDPSIQ